MTIPAKYTLTEAHWRIAELEEEKQILVHALREISEKEVYRYSNGFDLVGAEVVDIARTTLQKIGELK